MFIFISFSLPSFLFYFRFCSALQNNKKRIKKVLIEREEDEQQQQTKQHISHQINFKRLWIAIKENENENKDKNQKEQATTIY